MGTRSMLKSINANHCGENWDGHDICVGKVVTWEGDLWGKNSFCYQRLKSTGWCSYPEMGGKSIQDSISKMSSIGRRYALSNCPKISNVEKCREIQGNSGCNRTLIYM